MTHKGLNRQGSLYVLAALCVLTAATVVVPRLWPQAPQACLEYTRTFGENFDSINFKDAANSSVAQWPSGPITLPRQGSNFAVASPGGMGAYIYVCAAGDFTGDGYPDLVGLDMTRQKLGQTNPMSRLVLIRNQYQVDNDHPFLVDATTSYEEFLTSTGPASITAADYNGDGLQDFFFMRNSADEFGYTNFMAAMYINTGTPLAPAFQRHDLSPSLDFTARFQAAHIYINWAADHLTSADIDRDGDIDILAISQDRIFLIRNPGPADFNVGQFEIGELAYDARTGFTVGRGGSCVSAADLDNDGDVDVVGGTVNDIAHLVYYENNNGNFTRKELAIPNPDCTGSVGVLGRDFTGDGWPDIFVATDAWNAGNQAHMWFLRNRHLVDTIVDTPLGPETVSELSWEFKCMNGCNPIIPPSYDVDMSTPIDFDNDGDLDVVIADANHSGDYYLVENELAAVYELYGQAQSTNIGAGYLDPRLHAVTRVRVTSIRQGVLGGSSDGLKVQIKFSNNGGRDEEDWEVYQEFEAAAIADRNDLAWYEFKQFGADLRWKIVLTAEEDAMADFEHASFETPFVGDLQIEFAYVERREYSRASAAATIVTQSGVNKKLVIASSFIYPGFEGQLRAYDVSAVSLSGGAYSTLQTISSSDLDSATGRSLVAGAEIFWDAGQMLNDRDPDDRTIYTAVQISGNLVRRDFTRANAGNPNTAGTLAWYLQDVNNDNTGLIDFVRGTDRYWKLGDINHSTPVISGPPAEDSVYMGTGYAEFKAANAARPKVIYAGANDGMLHCFDATTGEELWGFIPFNLLGRLNYMYVPDPANGTRFFRRGTYVDGTPAVADVQIFGSWRTVLVCGQGSGTGAIRGDAQNLNYYWALDVTDPANPLPLWEVSHRDNQNRITMGETWSTPAIGKASPGGTARWVAFMGSGYDNDPAGDLAGRNFYAFAIDNGALLRTVQTTQVNSAGFTGPRQPFRYPNIMNAIVASPTAIDTDQNGFLNFVYVGDLDGRLYRMNVTSNNTNQWGLLAIYTDYLNYPIVTKPAVWMDALEGGPVRPRIYFGTGGHESGLGTYANDTVLSAREFSFVALIDNGSTSANNAIVEWYLGIPALLNKSVNYQVGSLGSGSKVWADSVIADGVVYCSTLQGSIEAVNPCSNLGERGRLYARYLRTTSALPVGGTAFKTTATTPPEYLELISKARRAVTVGEAERVGGRVNKREIYVQEYDSTLEKLEQPIGSLLRIKSWREIYRVIW